MTTLAEFMIITSTDNRPPMLEKSLYDSWKSRMEMYIENQENRRMILNSVQNEKLQAGCDLKATNIFLQGLPPDVYAIVNHHKVSKEICDRVKLLMQGTKLSLQEKEYECYQYVNETTPSEYKVSEQSTTRMEQLCDGRLVVPVFNQEDNLIACLNKAMDFLTVATIQDDMVTVQQVQGRQGQSYVGTGYKGNATSSGGNNAGGQTSVVKCYNCQGEGYMARQCTQPKRPRNTAWFKEKAMLAEA
ncbi:integrase, catalytic region, zinc finger, CCHC-type containing protein [Tanacetum coccineum]